ncbi:MAG: hypothetical protein ACPK85_05680 [Methanosarcina sp.]
MSSGTGTQKIFEIHSIEMMYGNDKRNIPMSVKNTEVYGRKAWRGESLKSFYLMRNLLKKKLLREYRVNEINRRNSLRFN